MSNGQEISTDHNGLNQRLSVDFALKAAKLGVWEINPNTRIVHWDQRCREMFGLDDDYLLLDDIVSHIHPDDRDWVATARNLAMTPGYSGEYDVTYRTIGAKDKVLRWVRFTGKAEYDDQKIITRFSGVAQDVTKEKQHQQQIQNSEAHFKGLIQQAPFAIAVYRSRDLIIDIANQAMIELWGKTPAVIGTKLSNALPELEGQPFIGILENVFDTGVIYQTDQQMVDLVVNGKLQSFWFKFTYQPLTGPDGKVYAILNMAVDITEQVLYQKRIEESQRKILASFEQSPVAIAIVSNPDLVFTMANPFYGELVGRSPEQLIGKSLLDILPELRGQGFDTIMKQVMDTGIPYKALEVPATVLRNGKLETIYVDLSYQPNQESDGSISGVLIIATHVTQLVLARKEVESRESQLRSIIENAPAAMGLFVGRDLIIELPNQAFIEIVGKGNDIAGKRLADVMPELENQAFLQILDDVYTTGKMFQSPGAQVNIVRNGEMTHNFYNITYSPLFDESGNVYAILDIAIDVTEQVKARQQISESQQQLSGAIELAELATWSLDIKAGKFTYSGRFTDWLGLDNDYLSENDAYNPVPEQYRQSVEEAVNEAIRPGSSGIYKNEHPIINRITGKQRIIQVQARVFYDSEGNPAILSGTAQDVTKQREVQFTLEQLVQERTEELETTNEELTATNEELAAINEEFAATNDDLAEANHLLSLSNQNLEQFAYIASHDLQEPLRKIQQFGDLLKKKYDSPSPDALIYLDRMQSAATRMSTLITDLLTYARISNNPQESQQISLHDVISTTLSDLEYRIQQTNAQITVDQLPIINGNKIQLGQLFQNLLSNALKFHDSQNIPRIHIRSRLINTADLPAHVKPSRWSSTYHLISVSDNGIGFEQQYADRIFQAFQRLHGKSEYEGTGIGLAICDKVVNNHGGAITAISQPGQGAVFEIYLPSDF
ncbi:PAS domain S-box protein [Dyadobacter sp. CY356]|uniref:PAS domain-containing sensor histidine kinase n=1 Tax=Dyadobacter sp. CY356 TaxID=2906442 RepID=UPI001F1C2A1A|nr:PAS domain S-box protein [Dyadobacter sp. CY356]MCF0056068.1 PAS domain-containing protein [Dyadobacter sp. CY356]